jgi:pimeloyl-ACP methyl ester carboxylesterase
MPILHSGGVDLHYEIAGEGDLVLLTHGSWSDGRSWFGVVPQLVEEFRVMTWDRRGHGRSGDGPGGMRQDAVDLIRLIESVDEPAHLVGSSFGSIVSLRALETEPDLVRSVAIHEPPLLEMLHPEDLEDDLAEEMRKNEIVVEIINQGRYEDAAEYFVDQIAVAPGAWAHMSQPARDTFAANAATFVGDKQDTFDPHPLDLEAIDQTGVPILITQGTESPPLLRHVVDMLLPRLGSARTETFEAAGHLPHRTHVDMWSESILEFLSSEAVTTTS